MSANITEDQLQNFCSITGTTVDRARFYLEAANGDLETAIGSFFESGGAEAEMNEEPAATRPQARPGQQGFGFHDDDDDDDEDDEEFVPKGFSAGRAKAPAPSSNTRSSKSSTSGSNKPRIATLRDHMSDEDENEDNEKQAFYAGGSEQSGQQILGPSGKKKVDDYIKDLFQKAKDNGAEEVSSGEAAASTSRGPVVYGTGYRLGTGNEPTEVVQGPAKPKQPKSHVLKLWKNGFTVDEDGPLRSYDDPQNKEFLASIQKGEAPRELIRKAEGAEVHLDMQDHRDEEYEPPKNKYVLYNDGYKLGSPTPTVVSNASASDRENNEQRAKQSLKLDESKPTTQIQIRLSDGSRLVIKANQTHTIRDLRVYINTARPEYFGRVYSLNSSFPNKELTEEQQSLKDANVLNAVITQKLIQ